MAGADTGLNDPAFRALDTLLQAQARAAPARDAIVDLETARAISFGALAVTTDAIARRLLAHGVTPGARILLAGGNSIDKLLLWIAIWRLGAVVCPLDPAFSGSGTARAVAAIVRPSLVLLPSDANTDAFDGSEHVLLRPGRWGEPARPDELALGADGPASAVPLSLPPAPGLADLASICCTSGTSGEPKLLLYDHASYWYNGVDTIDAIGLGPHDRLLEYRSFDWFSAQILSLMPCLQAGLTLCVAPRFSRSRLAGWIRAGRISVCVGVPATVNILLEAPLPQSCMHGVRVMTCSSAPLARLQWERFEAHYGIELLNMYGSSEAGWMCANHPGRRRLGSVGQPLHHLVFEVQDADGMPCAPGEPGQVVVSGAKLALGRLHAGGGFTPLRGAAFAMRDAAVRDADGFVRVLGRMDDLIIRGGVKIVPQEIEEVLLMHPDVVDAAALGVPDPVYGQEPACFVVLNAQRGTAAAPELLAWCAARLPREKLPKSLSIIDALPRNGRGKLQRDALRRLWWSARPHAAGVEADDDDALV